MGLLVPNWLWFVFVGIVIVSLFIDFIVLKKQGAHEVTTKEALIWSLVWIVLSFLFNGLLWLSIWQETGLVHLANELSLSFLTGYLIEKSLAVDNIFVFLIIFNYFKVPINYQKRVLMFGIVFAIILRAVMILIGGWLLTKFHWILYLFGFFLVVTGIKMWIMSDKESDLADNPALKLLNRVLSISRDYDGERFWTIENGRRVATPLLMVVGMVGLTDIIFAVDSIPAIFAITSNAFIVLSSNIFAILGLRAMFFLLQSATRIFHLLNYGLSVILVFIGLKMLLVDIYPISSGISLLVVLAILGVTMLLSAKIAPRDK